MLLDFDETVVPGAWSPHIDECGVGVGHFVVVAFQGGGHSRRLSRGEKQKLIGVVALFEQQP